MLANALFGLLLLAILLFGGVTALLVILEVLDPLLVAIGAMAVTGTAAVALLTMITRQRRNRMARELHVMRRSQLQRDRVPERYGSLAAPRDDDTEHLTAEPLARPLDADAPAPSRVVEADVSTVETALDAGLLTLFLEPVVEMPANRTVAYRARAGLPGAASPLDPATIDALPQAARARLELWMMGAGLDAAEDVLRVPVQCDASRALLGAREDSLGLAAILEDFEAHLLRLRSPGIGLDALEAGRLEDAVAAGAIHVATGLDPTVIEPSDAADLAARDVAACVFAVEGPARLPTAPRGLANLAEAGMTLQADGVATPEEGADLAQLGFTLFTGRAFGEPKRLRDAADDARAADAGSLEAEPAEERSETSREHARD